MIQKSISAGITERGAFNAQSRQNKVTPNVRLLALSTAIQLRALVADFFVFAAGSQNYQKIPM